MDYKDTNMRPFHLEGLVDSEGDFSPDNYVNINTDNRVGLINLI